MSALSQILNSYRQVAQTEREKGTYFEELIRTYLRYEATYADLYECVWLYNDWVKDHPEFGLNTKDTGIDLVAKTRGTDEFHAIQCKCYAEDYRVQKRDIDSFFTASGQKPFSRRFIVTTSNNWSENAEASLINQQPPVQKIDLNALEESQIEWEKYQPGQVPALKAKKSLLPHQHSALVAVKRGLQSYDRGKLIMACGTGKTFTSLKIAEEIAGKGKRVLFLVPSLSLLTQTLTEWTQESKTALHSFAVCSDSEVGKKRHKDDDAVNTFAHELRFPSTTNAASLAREMAKRHDQNHMSVVFSTYHSIQVLSDSQQQYGLEDFDLIICDEAHRTTGATFENEKESAFIKVHENDFLKATKRLYMTATPRIYGDSAKAKEESGSVTLCSMDNESLYGPELFVINFSEAVQRGLLCDYKVIVLAIDEEHVNQRLQNLLKDENNSLKVDDAAKIIGCWKALAKIGLHDELINDTAPMQRAVAFCQVIEASYKGKGHKVSSKQISEMFSAVVEEYQLQASEEEVQHGTLKCAAEHIDGSMNATEKENRINWLKAQPDPGTCKILSNVRCLSEGVDVPALDAVLFLTPRNSQIDVVQSVGRVMRTVKDPITGESLKNKGYVVLPVVIPAGMTPEEALNDNKVYKVVWDVLQALRSHDDSFDAMINKLDLMEKRPAKMEVIAVTGDVKAKNKTKNKQKKIVGNAKGGQSIGSDASNLYPQQVKMQFEVGEIERALHAKLVKKCGNRMHWEEWADDIAKIAQTHISRIKAIVENPVNILEKKAFNSFAEELRDNLNQAITDTEVIEMLAQHLITKPVFDALFKDYSFASNNPVSQAMQSVLDILQEHRLEKERDTLEKFYANVQMRADGIDNAKGKQKIVVELYENFFKKAFKKMTDRLGIVYTPVEVVDFIIHSVNYLLKKEFEQTLGSKGVHIVDPFTGTGTFVTRLLQSGLIKPEELRYKYRNEIHANEIVLLAYYIAAINIESTYHELSGGEYLSFDGICLTDTFQMYEKSNRNNDQLIENSERRRRQKELDIQVIIGNPPYSDGQENANDNNENVSYPSLDEKIRNTYGYLSESTNLNSLYNSYIRAIRWASDRLSSSGIIAFVTNGGYLDGRFADGLRKTLVAEFSSIYIYHLRGDQRTQGERSRKEGGKIFDSGSRAPIAICFLVKSDKEPGNIYYKSVDDYLSKDDKLKALVELKDISNLAVQKIVPDIYGDWVNQREASFDKHILIGSKKKNKTEEVLFSVYSAGIQVAGDAWYFNFSKVNLLKNIKRSIDFFNSEIDRYKKSYDGSITLKAFVKRDPKSFAWYGDNVKYVERGKKINFDPEKPRQAMYRPFMKEWVYFDKDMLYRAGRMCHIFPYSDTKNLTICISAPGSNSGFAALITDVPSELCMISMKGGTQCFPLYIIEEDKVDNKQDCLLEPSKKYSINEALLNKFRERYSSLKLNEEDLFYYIYGILHSKDYRNKYSDNLSKELPRIPIVNSFEDFVLYSNAGRELAYWHLNYETVNMYNANVEITANHSRVEDLYKVRKMRFMTKKGHDGKRINDFTMISYNEYITIKDIPLEAQNYRIGGRSAIEWIIEGQKIKTDTASGIINDANDWAVETINDSRYPLELLLRMITVSLETNKIVDKLPSLDMS